MKWKLHQNSNRQTNGDDPIESAANGCLIVLGLLVAATIGAFLLIAKGTQRQNKMEDEIEQLKSRDQPQMDYRQRAENQTVFPITEWPSSNLG